MSKATQDEGLPLSDFVEQGYLNNFLWGQGIEDPSRYRRTSDQGRDDERILDAEEDIYFDEVENLLEDRGERLGMDPELAHGLAREFTDMLIRYADRPPPVEIQMKELVDELERIIYDTPDPHGWMAESSRQLELMRLLL